MSDFWFVAVPTWLSSVGTVGAFAVGGMLLLREMRRDRADRELQHRASAALVVAWPIRVRAGSAGVPTVEAKLQVRNAGTEPVYRLCVQYRSGDQITQDEIGILPPGDLQRELPNPLLETWIRSEQRWIRRPPTGRAETADPFREPWQFDVELRFVDATGREWHRAANGTLAPVRAG